jgi:hypothetical protein
MNKYSKFFYQHYIDSNEIRLKYSLNNVSSSILWIKKRGWKKKLYLKISDSPKKKLCIDKLFMDFFLQQNIHG